LKEVYHEVMFETVDSLALLFNHICQHFPWLLDEATYAICLYFEEIIPEKKEEHQNLVNKEGGVRESRARRFSDTVRRLHVLLPNALYKSQGYVAKEGSGVHGSLLLKTIFKFLFKLEVFPPVIFYWNHQNYSNDFIKVFNTLPDDVTEPDWSLVRKCAFSSVRERDDGTYESTEKDESGTSRATIGIDGGVASQVANKRGNSKAKNGKKNHHSKPPFKKCTKNMQKLFMPATSFMKSKDARGDWLPSDVNYYELPDYPTYQTEFAAQNCKDLGNIIPSMRTSANHFV